VLEEVSFIRKNQRTPYEDCWNWQFVGT